MATSADVISFRLQYAEFKALTDQDIASELDLTDVFLDADMWSAKDYPTARFLFTAHNLYMLAQLKAQQQAMGDLMGFTDQTLSTVGFGERRIGFRQIRASQIGKNVYATGAGQQLAESHYGRLYLLLQSRNIHGILTV